MYLEKRWQPVWVLALSVLMTASLGIAYGSLLQAWFGWLTGGLTSAVAVWAWWARRSPISVSDSELRVGRMRLPLSVVGRVEVFSPAQMQERTGVAGRADDVLSIPSGHRGGVVVEINDPSDPYRHWVLASRRPGDLAAAIESARTASA